MYSPVKVVFQQGQGSAKRLTCPRSSSCAMGLHTILKSLPMSPGHQEPPFTLNQLETLHNLYTDERRDCDLSLIVDAFHRPRFWHDERYLPCRCHCRCHCRISATQHAAGKVSQQPNLRLMTGFWQIIIGFNYKPIA